MIQIFFSKHCTCRHKHIQREFSALCMTILWARTVAASYGLGIESQGWWAKFSTPVQTSRGAHPTPTTMGTLGKLLGA